MIKTDCHFFVKNMQIIFEDETGTRPQKMQLPARKHALITLRNNLT